MNMRRTNIRSKSFQLAVMAVGLAVLSSVQAAENSWRDDTALVSRQDARTIVRGLDGDKILFGHADAQMAIEWAMANKRTTVVLAGKYVINDRIDIPRDDVTLILDKNSELALNPDTTAHTYIGFRPDGSWKRLCMIYNKGRNNVRVISLGTIGSWTVQPPKEEAWSRRNRKGTPYRGTWPIFFDGRNDERTCGIQGGFLLTAGTMGGTHEHGAIWPHDQEAIWLVDSSGVEVPLIAHRFGGDGSIVLEGCEDIKLGMLVNLATTPGGKTGEVIDLNGRCTGITIERAIGERPNEIVDNNSSYADVGEVVSIGRPQNPDSKEGQLGGLLKFHGPSDGARYTSRPHPGRTALNVEKQTILEDAASVTMRWELPELPAALPAFTVKATVEVTMKDGSKKEYSKEVEIDVRRAD